MYRFLKRVKNSIKQKVVKDKPAKRHDEDSELNPEFMSAITVFANRLENRNISSLDKKEENVE